MARGLFKLAIFLLAVNALVRFVPPYWSHTQFSRELKDRALTWRVNTDHDVREQVLQMALDYGVPLEREEVAVRREGEHLFVDVAYTTAIEFFPGWHYQWPFTSSVDAWIMKPPLTVR